MKKLANYAGTKMNSNMYKLGKKKAEATFLKPKAKHPANHVVDKSRNLMKRKLDKKNKYNLDNAKLRMIIMA